MKRSVFGFVSTATLVAVLQPLQPANAATDPYVGASVTGNAKAFTLICGTCPVDSTIFPELVAGGPGNITADIEHAQPGYSLTGHAALTGPDALPTLGARASANVLVDHTIPKTFFHAASVTAEGFQRYTYGGTVAANYQLDYVIDGSFALGGNDVASLMQVFGGIILFKDGYTPGAEVNPSYGFDFKNANAAVAGIDDFTLTGGVAFTLEPGASFYVRALLGVTADSSHQIDGTVDALHTLTLSFSAGDASLLDAELSAVPLPEPAWLLTAGLLGVVNLRRRRGQAEGQAAGMQRPER